MADRHRGPSFSRLPTPNTVENMMTQYMPPAYAGDLVIEPPEIIFDQVNRDSDAPYRAELCITNKGKEMNRIRIEEPEHRKDSDDGFKLHYVKQAALAPGISMKAWIEFKLPPDHEGLEEMQDRLVVTGGPPRGKPAKVEINLLATLPAPKLSIPEHIVDLHFVSSGQLATKTIVLENIGTRDAEWRVEIVPPSGGLEGPCPVTFSPEGGMLAAFGTATERGIFAAPEPENEDEAPAEGARFSKCELNVKVTSQDLGPLRYIAKIWVEGLAAPYMLDISAEVVEHKVELVMNDAITPCTAVEFEPCLMGDELVREAILVNRGPHPVAFNITADADPTTLGTLARAIEDELKEMNLPEEARKGGDGEDEMPMDTAITVVPQEGTIPAHGDLKVQFKFNPVQPDMQGGFKTSQQRDMVKMADGAMLAVPQPYASMVVIDTPDLAQQMHVSVTGQASKASLTVDHRIVRFGECPVNERRDVTVTLRNTSKVKAPWSVSNIANFQFRPSKGVLQPLATQTVVFTFRPAQMGQFKTSVNLAISKDRKVIPIRLVGTASSVGTKEKLKGGLHMLPETFEPKMTYIKSLPAGQNMGGKKFTRDKPWEVVNLAMSTTWDEVEAPNSGMQDYTFSVQELERRAAKRDYYINWLKGARQKRAKGVSSGDMKRVLTKKVIEERALPLAIKDDSDDEEDPDEKWAETLDLVHARDIEFDPLSYRGMVEPVPPMPKGVTGGAQFMDPLWQEDTQEGSHQMRLPQDDKKDPRKGKPPLKAAPSTVSETRDCAKELTTAEIGHNILVSHQKEMDFGQVCVNSKETRYLSFANDLGGSVLISLGRLDTELKLSTPQAQVVPSGQIASFDITFQGKKEDVYKKPLQYMYNGKPAGKVLVKAEIVPINVKMEPTDLNLEFPPDSLEKSVSKTVTLDNPGNAACEFFWASRPCFTVSPEQGRLEPYTQQKVTVTWTPTANEATHGKLNLHVPDGEDQELTVTGSIAPAKVKFWPGKKLDLGQVPVGIEQSTTLTVKNTGDHPAVCFVEPFDFNETGITITPEKFKLDVKQEMTLNLQMTPPRERMYANLQVQVDVRGSKPLRLPLQAEAVIPLVEHVDTPAVLDFQDVTINGSERKMITLVNRSSIGAHLQLNLEQYPDFVVVAAPLPTLEQIDPAVSGVEESQAQMSQDERPPGTQASTGTGKTMLVKRVEEPSGIRPSGMSAHDDMENVLLEHYRSFDIKIAPGQTLNFFLDFVPVSATTHDFVLPLKYEGIDDPAQLARRVTAEGTRPFLVMSKKGCCVDFGDKVVSRDPTRRVPVSQDLIFTNKHNEGIKWDLDDSLLKEGVDALSGTQPIFFVSPTKGALAPEETVQLRVTFSPTDNREYEAKIPLYLDTQTSRDRPYLVLTLKGNGVFPMLTFDPPDMKVTLQTVPLNVVSKGAIVVHNVGYDDLELTTRPPAHGSVHLQVEYPEGKQLGLTMDRLTIVVSFKSEEKVSFHDIVELIDSENNTYQIHVAGCADNCVLTNYSFLREYREGPEGWDYYVKNPHNPNPVEFMDKRVKIAYQKDEQRRRDRERKHRQRQRLIESGKKPPPEPANEEKEETLGEMLAKIDKERSPGVDRKRPANVIDPRLPPFLVSWLNANVMSNRLEEIPKDLVQTQGRLAYEAIEAMCGKKLPGRIRRMPQNKAEAVQELIKQYDQMLYFLKERGALLNTVESQHLLSSDEYVRFQLADAHERGQRMTPTQQKERRAAWEASHPEISTRAWITVLLQSIRCFSLSRITMKSYGALPGTFDMGSSKDSKAGKNPEMQKLERSNVYTVSEGILLKWILYHVNEKTPAAYNPQRIMNFDHDFDNGALLCHLFDNHVAPLVNPENMGPYTMVDKRDELKEYDKRMANIDWVMDAMRKLNMGLGDVMSRNLFEDPNPAITLLLTLHFYNFLPQLWPKQPVEFGATLGAITEKAIALNNTSGKPVHYRAVLEGSNDFKIPEESVTLPPKSSGDFMVQLNPRFSTPVEARLTLFAERTGSVSASHMVFRLKSRIDNRVANSSINLATTLYTPVEEKVEVRNPFAIDAVFSIQTVQELVEPTMPLPNNNRGRAAATKKGGKAPADKRSDEEKAVQQQIDAPFGCDVEKITIPANGTATITVKVVPMAPGLYRCELVFLNEDAGEFMIEATCNVDLPKAMEIQPEWSVESSDDGSSFSRLLQIANKNEAQEKAIAELLNRVPNAMRTKCRSEAQRLTRPETEDGSPATYTVIVESGNPPNFQSRETMQLEVDSKQGSTGGQRGASRAGPVVKSTTLQDIKDDSPLDQPGSLVLNFFPREAGTYQARVMVLGAGQAAYDVRIFHIKTKVTTPPMETSLDFKAPVRSTVTQKIPIVNRGVEEWQLSSQITGSKSFTGPQNLVVPPDQQAEYELKFSPKVIGEESGELILKNPKGGFSFKYNLSGVAEEPLAENHVVIRCNARETTEQVFLVPRFVTGKSGRTQCKVECDLGFVSGPETLTLTGETSEYVLKLTPQIGGPAMGSITFTDEESGDFLWYTLDVQVDSPHADQRIDLQATVRQVCRAEICLQNPLPEAVVFEVVLEPGDVVIGSEVFTLAPNETNGVYELFFSPLVAGSQSGCVKFINDRVGEFWYELTLEAEPAPPVQLPDLTCSVGATVSEPITIQNPLGSEAVLVSTVSNRTNYEVTPPNVALPPYGSATVELIYTPSSLTETEKCDISLSNPTLGTWLYTVRGRGELPGVMAEQRPEATIGEPQSYTFPFRNPFVGNMVVDILLHRPNGVSPGKETSQGAAPPLPPDGGLAIEGMEGEEDDGETFKMLLRKTTNVTLAPFATLQIPVSFNPSSIAEKHAMLEVRGAYQTHRNLTWVFPIRGIVNAQPFPKAFQFRCKAKAVDAQVVELPLRSLADMRGPETFDYELNVPPSMQTLINSSLRVNPVAATISDPNQPVTFQIVFQPMRPFSTSVQLVIVRSTGGRWPFEIQLDAQEPEPDDMFTIEAELKTTASVCFRLTNTDGNYAPFQAYFKTDAAHTLSVHPATGVLAPAGSEGTLITVAFAPMEYGKLQRGRLVIQTEAMHWTYEVTGTHPHVAAPTNVQSKVETRLPADVEGALGQRKKVSVIRQNMKGSALQVNRSRIMSSAEQFKVPRPDQVAE